MTEQSNRSRATAKKRAAAAADPEPLQDEIPVKDEPDPGDEPVESATPGGSVEPDVPVDAGQQIPELTVEEQAAEPGDQSSLVELADAYGIATGYWDWHGNHVQVGDGTLQAVLGALGVDAHDDEAIELALLESVDRSWRRVLPATTVVTAGSSVTIDVHVEHGESVEVEIELEGGGRRALQQVDNWTEPRVVDSRLVGQAGFTVPGDLPLGYHTLRASHPGGQAQAPLIVTPHRLELPPALRNNRAWGFMTQLYSVRSSLSWGMGDLADLAELAGWSARAHGAGFVLVNPLHAAEPVAPMEPSPYLPTTRRFVNPIYLRVEDIREVAYMPATERAIVEWQAEAMRSFNTSDATLDRDSVWSAKQSALEAVYGQPRTSSRQAAFDDFKAREGSGLRDFATWCALAEKYGGAGTWPAHAQDPSSPAVAELQEELADRIDFFSWLQWCLDEQLAHAQRTALEAGMTIGIMHDLAVGVHPAGADTWALGDVLARGVTVGAPPDAFNQQGQDWSQPPWRPDRLAELGYAPYRDMLRTLLRHAGGIRIDHIMGLFRLWWVPAGSGPGEGTYVRYDHEALVGVLALEAHRAGAFVVGEDLGTVEPWVRDYLRDRGVFGTSILWFERDDEGKPIRPERWRELCLATVTSHDLPPTSGYLAGEHIEMRDKLGLLTRSVADETRIDEADRASMLELLHQMGLLVDQPTERDRVEALHRFLRWTPARLIGVSLADAVGDRRAINQPGTNDQYPNWRLPLSDGVGRPVLLEDVMLSIRATALARAVGGH